MEWTGARYADEPTVEARTWIDAPPERVWELVSDIGLMPSLSTELQSVRWLDGATGSSLGARFVGTNKHESLGEWTTTSHLVEYEPGKLLTWAVENPEHPTGTWQFSLEPREHGTELRQWMRMGPARSGISFAIDRMPDKEQKIVFVRLREIEQSIIATLEAIKKLAEAAASAEPEEPEEGAEA